MSKVFSYISQIFLVIFTLASEAHAAWHIIDASYEKESGSVVIEFGCGGDYERDLFELRFEPGIVPPHITGTFDFKGNETKTRQQNYCETAKEFDVSSLNKPTLLTITDPDRRFSKTLLID